MALHEEENQAAGNDISLITPAAGKRLCISFINCTFATVPNARTEFRIAIDTVTEILLGMHGKSNKGNMKSMVLGDVDAPLKLDRQTGSKIKVIYEEI